MEVIHHLSPVTNPTLAVIHSPCPREPHNLTSSIRMLARPAHGREIMSPVPTTRHRTLLIIPSASLRHVAQQAPCPHVDMRLTRLVPRLLQERNQRRSAGASEATLRVPLVIGLLLRQVRQIDPAALLRMSGGGSGFLLARRDDDVPADHLDVLVTHAPQHGEAGIVSDHECAIFLVGFDELADVCDGGDIDEEAAMRGRHVLAHLGDEIV